MPPNTHQREKHPRYCFNGHPPLGVNATRLLGTEPAFGTCFNGHPPLGVNATRTRAYRQRSTVRGFNGHPPLGVNATVSYLQEPNETLREFQWAPTLGGECYKAIKTLQEAVDKLGFNGHPPLGVNATKSSTHGTRTKRGFQWAPTLGGECYAFYPTVQ